MKANADIRREVWKQRIVFYSKVLNKAEPNDKNTRKPQKKLFEFLQFLHEWMNWDQPWAYRFLITQTIHLAIVVLDEKSWMAMNEIMKLAILTTNSLQSPLFRFSNTTFKWRIKQLHKKNSFYQGQPNHQIESKLIKNALILNDFKICFSINGTKWKTVLL